MTTVDDKFKIFVGDTDRTSKAQFGFPEAGMSSLKAGTSLDERELSPFGDQIFPNYVELWGRRVINGKAQAADKGEIAVTDPAYKGEIDFLDYGDPAGQTIFCRYVKGHSSLDYQYQISRLGLVKKEDDEANLWLQLPNGEHEVDPTKDKAFAMMIKQHPFNRNSKSKSPQVSTFVYVEVERFRPRQDSVEDLDKNFEARAHVKAAKTKEGLMVLHEIWSKAGQIEYSKADEASLYQALMIFANENSETALRLIGEYKADSVDVIEKAKAFEAIDTSKDGELKAGLTSPKVIMSGIPAKGEGMLQYLMDNCLTPDGKKAIDTLHDLASQNFK